MKTAVQAGKQHIQQLYRQRPADTADCDSVRSPPATLHAPRRGGAPRAPCGSNSTNCAGRASLAGDGLRDWPVGPLRHRPHRRLVAGGKKCGSRVKRICRKGRISLLTPRGSPDHGMRVSSHLRRNRTPADAGMAGGECDGLEPSSCRRGTELGADGCAHCPRANSAGLACQDRNTSSRETGTEDAWPRHAERAHAADLGCASGAQSARDPWPGPDRRTPRFPGQRAPGRWARLSATAPAAGCGRRGLGACRGPTAWARRHAQARLQPGRNSPPTTRAPPR